MIKIGDCYTILRLENTEKIIYIGIEKNQISDGMNFEKYVLDNTKLSKEPINYYINVDYNIDKHILDTNYIANKQDRLNILYLNYISDKLDIPNLTIKNGSIDRNFLSTVELGQRIYLFSNLLSTYKYTPMKAKLMMKPNDVNIYIMNKLNSLNKDNSEFMKTKLYELEDEINFFKLMVEDIIYYFDYKKKNCNIVQNNQGLFVYSNNMTFNTLDVIDSMLVEFSNNFVSQYSSLYKISKIMSNKNIQKYVIYSNIYESLKTLEYLVKNFSMKITHISDPEMDITDLNIKISSSNLKEYSIHLQVLPDKITDVSHFPSGFD